MEFDKTRIYTAVNADELEIGSTCIFADSVYELYERFKDKDVESYIWNLTGISTASYIDRFEADKTNYCLAYLIEQPAEPKYKPFKDIDKAREVINKHGGWVSRRDCKNYFFITGYVPNLNEEAGICIGPVWHTLQELYDDFIFTDDRTPCGELVEE